MRVHNIYMCYCNLINYSEIIGTRAVLNITLCMGTKTIKSVLLVEKSIVNESPYHRVDIKRVDIYGIR